MSNPDFKIVSRPLSEIILDHCLGISYRGVNEFMTEFYAIIAHAAAKNRISLKDDWRNQHFEKTLHFLLELSETVNNPFISKQKIYQARLKYCKVITRREDDSAVLAKAIFKDKALKLIMCRIADCVWALTCKICPVKDELEQMEA